MTIWTVLRFAILLSLTFLSGPLSGQFQLPTVPQVRATSALAVNWLPAGPSTKRRFRKYSQATQWKSAFMTEQSRYDRCSIDIYDDQLSLAVMHACTGMPNVNPSAIRIRIPQLDPNLFEIQIEAQNNSWSIPLNFGFESTCTIAGGKEIGAQRCRESPREHFCVSLVRSSHILFYVNKVIPED